jgi:hypothetical protein
LIAVAVLWPPMAAAAPVEDMIVQEIACLRPPDPTPIMLKLFDENLVGDAEPVRADSRSCWEFVKPMTMGSLAFTHVCASHEDPNAIARYPELYFRGSGTSAGTSLGLVAEEPSGTVERWAAESLPADAKGYVIEPSAMVGGGIEISCNSLYREGAL